MDSRGMFASQGAPAKGRRTETEMNFKGMTDYLAQRSSDTLSTTNERNNFIMYLGADAETGNLKHHPALLKEAFEQGRNAGRMEMLDHIAVQEAGRVAATQDVVASREKEVEGRLRKLEQEYGSGGLLLGSAPCDAEMQASLQCLVERDGDPVACSGPAAAYQSCVEREKKERVATYLGVASTDRS